ncbi:hypothetical protein L596_010041 [Steinernema carpocapsae]|uniref:F-box associated domain-containing protein n=1 Tax=Steinernema carpocapsae TaxID=34508 RepID=A0A4U5PHF5_STECR|nr:hypothetical protein L596_010041 [Steinernema carpocapsae]
MDSLPASFSEELMIIASKKTPFAYRVSLLSGTVGSYAQHYIQKVHNKTFLLRNGIFVDSGFFNLSGERTHSKDLRAKYRDFTTLQFHTPNGEVPQIDGNFLKKFALEPGSCALILQSYRIDNKWIQEFVSWKKLRVVDLRLRCKYEPQKLLQKLLDRKQLLRLDFDFCEDTEIELGCEFLLQEQFQHLFYGRYRQESLKQLTALQKKNKEKLLFSKKMSVCTTKLLRSVNGPRIVDCVT